MSERLFPHPVPHPGLPSITRSSPVPSTQVRYVFASAVALALSACGGGGSGDSFSVALAAAQTTPGATAAPAATAPIAPEAPAAPVVSPEPPTVPVTTVPPAVPAKPTTLSISLASLTLSAKQPSLNPALTGNPRVLTITNTGAEEAVDVAITSSPPLPVGTTVSPAACATIPAAGGTCVLTITPGSVPTAAVGDTASAPAVVTIAGSNTNTLTSQIAVLAYGSVYQAGYVFAVDDTLPISGQHRRESGRPDQSIQRGHVVSCQLVRWSNQPDRWRVKFACHSCGLQCQPGQQLCGRAVLAAARWLFRLVSACHVRICCQLRQWSDFAIKPDRQRKHWCNQRYAIDFYGELNGRRPAFYRCSWAFFSCRRWQSRFFRSSLRQGSDQLVDVVSSVPTSDLISVALKRA